MPPFGLPHGPLLTFDCGNSTIQGRRWDGALWSTSSVRPDFSELAAFVRAAPADDREQPLRAVAVSVVASALQALREALADVPLEVADVDLRCPLKLDYETVATLGADRWVGAYAAHRVHGSAIVVDCGTATTVNVVDGSGTFRGGAIAPGLAAFVAGLAEKAPALPAADLDAQPRLPGRSTQASVDAGVLLGWASLVEGLVAAARRGGDPDATLVITGGNAERLMRLGSFDAVLSPSLLHDGLELLAEANPGQLR